MRFLHIADVHLGYQQYNAFERIGDFGMAFERALRYGVAQRVDAILIAGDLFHKAAVEPTAYIQATQVLGLARDAEIPVIAIEGNHDQARYRDWVSWLQVLAHEGYLVLLKPVLEGERAVLEAWDGAKGGYIDVENVRIIGVPWLGAAMTSWLPGIMAAIERLPQAGVNYTILLGHIGLEGEVPNRPGCLTHEQLASLKKHVDHLALGHLHKPFARDDWAYNPGSLEVCAVDECRWTKGMYDVRVDSAGASVTRYVASYHRPFHFVSFAVDAHATPAELYRALGAILRQRASQWQQGKLAPVIQVNLEGRLPFDWADLDLRAVRKAVAAQAAPLLIRVNTQRLHLPGVETVPDDDLSQSELELSVLREIALRDSRYAPQAEAWARLMLEIKALALEGQAPETILETLEVRMREMEEASPRC